MNTPQWGTEFAEKYRMIEDIMALQITLNWNPASMRVGGRFGPKMG
jgi:hypothetical protein